MLLVLQSALLPGSLDLQETSTGLSNICKGQPVRSPALTMLLHSVSRQEQQSRLQHGHHAGC